jgi:hypothetical protein
MTPPLRKALLGLACVLSLMGAAGCGDPCRSLATQICQCLPDDGTRAACNERAKEAESTFPIRDQDAQVCQQLLDKGQCDCNYLNTPEGRQTCGLSY